MGRLLNTGLDSRDSDTVRMILGGSGARAQSSMGTVSTQRGWTSSPLSWAGASLLVKDFWMEDERREQLQIKHLVRSGPRGASRPVNLTGSTSRARRSPAPGATVPGVTAGASGAGGSGKVGGGNPPGSQVPRCCCPGASGQPGDIAPEHAVQKRRGSCHVCD